MNQIFTRGPMLSLRMMLFVLLSIALLTFDHRGTYLHKTRSALALMVTPLQYIVDAPMSFLDWAEDSLSSRHAIVEENANLKAQVLLLKANLQKLISLEKENSQLRDLLGSSTRISGKVLGAKIMAVATNPFAQQVTLNKGSLAGVFVGQPVLDAGGVMGQVIRVSPATSQVMLVDDVESAVPAEVNRNGVRAISIGRGVYGDMELVHVPVTADIQEKDVLVTSGLGQRYPRGYPLGVVTRVVRDPGEHFAKIQVSPSAHLSRSRLVLLVWLEGSDA